ncbi:tripartite tricarboxylate transporter permease [Numidum massiliense]|uniref:tripartite tricarboxylate transporter permease n=1 Tax=Numidum massiliense TaxID=1522315 RepID=UPI00093F5A86|nr:tripartite tricarboxylate transporter permease [Numidum massiliense]
MGDVISYVLSALTDPINLLAMTAGVAGGIVVGALPGLTATMALALMLPFTFSLEAITALIALGGIYIGAIYGGSISAILINTPGTPSSIATTFDGFPLTQRGKAEHALVSAAFSSGVGGILGGFALLFISPVLVKLALSFGPPEYFWVAMFGLTIIANLASSSLLKGFLGGSVGLLLSTVGIAPIGGESRYTFGFATLQGGVDLTVALIGLFCIPEVIRMVEQIAVTHGKMSYRPQKGVASETIRALLRKPLLFIRSSLIGIVVGIIPGAGGNVASLLSYDMTVRFAKDKASFGCGNIEGVAASEAGNNAEVGGSLVPLLSLGIPGAAPAAVLLGALTMQGIRPGPDLFSTNAALVYTFSWAFIIANVLMFVFAFFGAKVVARAIAIPTYYLAPLIICLTVVGSYALRNYFFDVAAMLVLGIVGYVLKRFGFDPGPIVLGLILGPIAEVGLVQSMLTGQAQGSIWLVFFTRPLSLALIALCFFSLAWPVMTRRRERRRQLSSPSPDEQQMPRAAYEQVIQATEAVQRTHPGEHRQLTVAMQPEVLARQAEAMEDGEPKPPASAAISVSSTGERQWRVNRHSVLAVILLVIYGTAVWHTFSLHVTSAVFPRTVALIALGLSLLYFTKSVRFPVREPSLLRSEWRRVLTSMCHMAVFAALLWAVGFLFASVSFLMFFAGYLQRAHQRGNGRRAVQPRLLRMLQSKTEHRPTMQPYTRQVPAMRRRLVQFRTMRWRTMQLRTVYTALFAVLVSGTLYVVFRFIFFVPLPTGALFEALGMIR